MARPTVEDGVGGLGEGGCWVGGRWGSWGRWGRGCCWAGADGWVGCRWGSRGSVGRWRRGGN
ncbi:hypothetical protein Sipo7851_45385 [Streptomyces ipomoeae]|nr:hypothetical protein Sipo7851_45385 [Streptomyces ipomoeae]